MPWATEIQDALAPVRGAAEAAVLVGRADRTYAELLRSRPRFRDPRLNWHVDHQILPVVAVYRAVEHDEGPTAATATVELALDAVSKASRYGPVLALIERLPRSFDAFRRLTLAGAPIVTPSSGWSIDVTVDSETELSFDVRRCFYVDVLGALGLPELAWQLCGLDDRRYGSLRTIAFSRGGTIARGSSKCDFHFAPKGV